MKAGVGYSDIPDSAAAGRKAAEQAVSAAGRSEPCDLALVFCTARHDQKTLRGAVASVIGESVPVYGGGAAGVITGGDYGYAGNQAGVACLWLDGAGFEAFTEGGLDEGEEASGFRLGRKLAERGAAPESPVLLLYDAIGRDKGGGMRLNMATHILTGLEKALGFLPRVSGAGLMGDHNNSLTSLYTGKSMEAQGAMALIFSGDVRVDTTVVHGCRPASDYYAVTKADGHVILEIDGKPALGFMDSLLGPEVTPEEYPFFLLFGVNLGEKKEEYDEDQYASRLCLGIDRERGGIVMFEPDMTEGTKFQIMYRALSLGYMKPKIEAAFQNLDGREPVFAMYIDCAGRCAGYGGTDTEDALILQQAVAGRVPVLGIYTGVEIAPVAGSPHGLDWSGVFCLFSQEGKGNARRAVAEKPVIVPRPIHNAAESRVSGLCEQNAAQILASHLQATKLRYELELNRRGFSLLSELSVSVRQESDDYKDAFTYVARRMNACLNMQKTLMLVSRDDGLFQPAAMHGFTPGEEKRLHETAVSVPEELLGTEPVIVTGADGPGRFGELREAFGLPYFISAPVFLQDKASVLLLTGRAVEQPPYFTRLSPGDYKTVHAVASLLGSVVMRLRLDDVTHKAETDALTGLKNRAAFKRLVNERLNNAEKPAGAFMMIDVDYFKSVNDVHGHIAGDSVLKACADAMRRVLRDSDIIGRQGGDEFAVFCPGIGDAGTAREKAGQIIKAWQSVFPAEGAKHITASIGVALFPYHGATFQELYGNADAALYAAKENGRDRAMVFKGGS